MQFLWYFKEISHNPYFNRWFSAIYHSLVFSTNTIGHNPYFNRWFSAIVKNVNEIIITETSQSLF